jgi:hypothetical protein
VDPVAGNSLTFAAASATGNQKVILQPLTALNRQRYNVYWDGRAAG